MVDEAEAAEIRLGFRTASHCMRHTALGPGHYNHDIKDDPVIVMGLALHSARMTYAGMIAVMLCSSDHVVRSARWLQSGPPPQSRQGVP
jgi:hypothetical protein